MARRGRRDRAGTTGDDLVSVLLRAEMEGGALTADEMRGFVFTLLVAGSITTAYLIGSAVVALAADPALLARARPTRGHRAIVEETLRYEAPVQLMFRTATTPVEIAGVTIPAGATVLPLIGSANRDETCSPIPTASIPIATPASTSASATACTSAWAPRSHGSKRASRSRSCSRLAPRLEITGDVTQMTSLVFRGPTAVPLSL